MIKAGSVFTDIPLITNPSMQASGLRVIDSLPQPHWAVVNQEPQNVKGKPTPFEEQVWIVRDQIDVDHYLYKDKNAIQDPFDIQIEMYLRGLAYDLNYKFINNNHRTGNANAFVGVRERLDYPQIYGNNPACKIDAGTLDMSDAGMTTATANKMIRLIQQALDEIGAPDGTDVAIYMNDDLLRRIEQGVRMMGAGGGFDMTKDAFDRRILTYKNAKILNIGRQAPQAGGVQSTYVISSTETTAGLDGANGTPYCTSFYAIKFGKNDFGGWQFEPMKPTPPEKLNNGVTYRVVMDWAVGLWQPNTRAVARVFDIKVA